MSGISQNLEDSPALKLAGWEAIIGLEVHAQLSTHTKMFCSCRNVYGDPPNTHTCPTCLGLPGSLPVPNVRAIEYAIKLGVALGCEITPFSRFARKNYFYPDLPKGYQISQYEEPLCRGGSVKMRLGGTTKEIPLIRIHLEEDAGKSIHSITENGTGVDFNRCGVPLVEIVTEPVIGSPEEARIYLSTLKQILEYLEICDCNMEEGNLRCDANISVRRQGEKEMGTRTEMKNLNSFRAVERGLEFEISRQVGVLKQGGRIEHVTLLWNEETREAEVMRAKEEAHDYRYFPDPDLVPVTVSGGQISKIRAALPELPYERQERFVRQYGLRLEETIILTSETGFADYFEKVVKLGAVDPNEVSKAMVRNVRKILKERVWDIGSFPVEPSRFKDWLDVLQTDATPATGSVILEEMVSTGKSARDILRDEDLSRISDEQELNEIIHEVIENSPDEVARYQEGNKKLLGYFMGQVMKKTGGRSDPRAVRSLLEETLEGG